jgi:hypothetical protein
MVSLTREGQAEWRIKITRQTARSSRKGSSWVVAGHSTRDGASSWNFLDYC